MANPIFKKFAHESEESTMTVQGAIWKTLYAVAILLLGAALNLPVSASIGFGIIGFISALVIIFYPKTSPYMVSVYALSEGVILRYITSLFELKYPGIAIQAVALTVSVLFIMLVLYYTRTIKVTDKLRSIIIISTSAIFFVYLIDIIFMMFHSNIKFLHDNSLLSIGISLVVVVVASLNLLLDFEFIEDNANNNAPDYVEWYSAFGLLATLIWLYLELLKLLAKLYSKD